MSLGHDSEVIIVLTYGFKVRFLKVERMRVNRRGENTHKYAPKSTSLYS